MSAATPGPWRVRKNWAGKLFIDGPDGRIANCPGGGNANKKIATRGLANARLLASAPDLLDALLSAENASQELCNDQDPANECWVTLAKIRAAIAKAEGR